jgi:hypothetical protein
VFDAYRVLQVDPSAEPEVIEAAYRRLARKYHPDVNSEPTAAARMKELSAAYDVLRYGDRRAEYDRRRTRLWRRWRRRRGASSDTPAHKVYAETPSPWGDLPCCRLHAGLPAVDTCCVCGATLCHPCASMFRPVGCAPCVLRRARRVQGRVALAAGAFAASALTVVVGAIALGAPLTGSLLAAYLVAATILGIVVVAGRMWRSGWQDEPRDGGLGITFLVWVGLLVGWVGAPVLLGKLAWDLRSARRLVVSARTALRAS